MKKYFLLFLLIVLSFPMTTFSQGIQVKENQVKEPATKLEKFLSKRGRIIVKDYYKIGRIPGTYDTRMELTAIVIYEPGSELKNKGIQIQVEKQERYGRTDTSFLDFEEVESLSKAVTYMTKLLSNWKGVNKEYTEVVFSTKGDFQIGFYQQGTERQIFASSGYVGKVSCFFDSDNLSFVKKYLEEGLKILKEK
ncbi:MAG: hypothetical protein ACFFG0_17595 [Candidatus Thorarchaeota archaeon]